MATYRAHGAALAWTVALFFIPVAAWSQPDPSGGLPGPSSSEDEETFPLSPPDGTAWFFFDPQAPDAAALRAKVREVAWGLGCNMKEFDLSRPEYFDLLSDIVLGRGFRRVAPVELFVGDRHLAGPTAIARFLEGWKAGTEVLREEPVAPPEQETPAAPQDQEASKETTQAGTGAATDTKVEAGPGPIADPSTDPGPDGGQVPALVQKESPQIVLPPPRESTESGLIAWLKRYKLSVLAILAAIVFFALSVRRGQPGN